MTPPLFDTIQIAPPASITLKDSLRNRQFAGTYALDREIVRWTFHPKDSPVPIEHALHFSFTNEGALVLRSAAAKHSNEQQVEWVFLPSDRFLPTTTVSGDWIIPGKSGEPDTHWILLPDGSLGHKEKPSAEDSFWGYYRVWNTVQKELMLTTVMWVQGEGAFAVFQRLEMNGGEMKVTGRVPPGIPPQPPQVWKRAPLSQG